MIQFFQKSSTEFFVIGLNNPLSQAETEKITWLLNGAQPLDIQKLQGAYIGPRKEMLSPWCSNALDIFHNCGIHAIYRIEPFVLASSLADFDPMLQQQYNGLDQHIFKLDRKPDPIIHIEDIAAYNEKEGLALSEEEITFLENVSKELGRDLTDSEVFGFSQINSEHCRHKIFNGQFIIDGNEKAESLFQLIKKTSSENPNHIVSAYKDNVAFIAGPVVEQFAPKKQHQPEDFALTSFESVISLKAETHNFPTTVEPFNGAATGSGGEIRDRMAGGQGSIPLAGTAVYMTSYSRLEKGRSWEKAARKWLYQSPKEILIKASNGASDFGNKFGQPLIAGSVLTFEHEEGGQSYGFDKVIMMAGGIGFGKRKNAKKKAVQKDQQIVVSGGDNYRIGMGGSAVSSVDTGAMASNLELNAVQRSNPEMQKRVANLVRAMAELDDNPLVSIHDHGAGGHLNCLSELVEDSGGKIDLEKLPIGDPTLSEKEILGNESQERMGLVIDKKDADYIQQVAERERAPFYIVGQATGDDHLSFVRKDHPTPFDLKTSHLFGSSPKTILRDTQNKRTFREAPTEDIKKALEKVLQLEAVACKDWLTNKVDRCVTGKVATQQTTGELQLPLNNVAVMALDFHSLKGIATSIGHAPVPGLVQAGAGSRLSVTEALTNLVWAPLTHGLKGVSLSANWMWPAKNTGENARLYEGVESLSQFAIDLGINVPTGKDSLSMTQKYPDGKKVYAPGTVIVSSVGEVEHINRTVSPALAADKTGSELLYLDFSANGFHLGGSSYAQVQNAIGSTCPDAEVSAVIKSFEAIQKLIKENLILSGHDVSSGGLITTLLEMNFPNTKGGMQIHLDAFDEDLLNILFSEKPAVVIQVQDEKAKAILEEEKVDFVAIGSVSTENKIEISHANKNLTLDINHYRDVWRKTSDLLDLEQTPVDQAGKRAQHYKLQPLKYQLPKGFSGTYTSLGLDPQRKSDNGLKAAIIREQGVNSDREMAYALWLAGFDVRDVHMTDLITGREDLSDIRFIVFVGGFSNSDVLGSAKGWAGSFRYNEKARRALENFYAREDTLSLGVCNGCQLMMELELIYPGMHKHPKMHHNASEKFECGFLSVDIPNNNTVMLGSLSETRMGIWMAHGEGRFDLPDEKDYEIPMKYGYDTFPGNPNGSSFATAALASKDGRHLAMMPHLERSLFPWNWPHHEQENIWEVSPWMIPFTNAREWIKNHS